MSDIKISLPWVKLYHEVENLFRLDPEVKVSYDSENYVIKLYVDNEAKADALTQLLPTEKTFGNIKVKISVIPANKTKQTPGELFNIAFSGNPVMSFVKEVQGLAGTFTYVVFQKEVVQYFNDNMADLHGLESTLYQTIAKDIFDVGEDGIFFCTDI